MTQVELDREVSRATGESIRKIRQHGFGILRMRNVEVEEELETVPLQIVDWDQQDAIRRRAA